MNSNATHKWVIGLTGSILSGKSTALNYFARQGAFTLSADEIVHQLYQVPKIKKRLQSYFGTIETKEIASQIFASPEKRKWLERFIHPLVKKELALQIRRAEKPLVVVEVPLLFERGWDKMMDLNVLVMADDKTLPARLRERKMSLAQYKERLKTQWPENKKTALADVIFFHCTKNDLKRKIERFCDAFENLIPNRSHHGRK